MPELPEVESVCRGLHKMFSGQPEIVGLRQGRSKLRKPWPPGLAKKLLGQRLLGASRRAKYILMDTDDYVILNHLGMTGTWRLSEVDANATHDHLSLEFNDGMHLIYRDPRRFGQVELFKKDKPESLAGRLEHLGPEPLEGSFDGKYLFDRSRGRKQPIKNFIMDQAVVVGVGNIYASEALFRAHIRPTRRAQSLSLAEVSLLAQEVKSVLGEAIQAGGTSLRNYRNSDGQEGGFKPSLRVYGRAGEACNACGTQIKKKTIGGRSSFWCPDCQAAR